MSSLKSYLNKPPKRDLSAQRSLLSYFIKKLAQINQKKNLKTMKKSQTLVSANNKT